MKPHIAIIGGGAAGFFAAISCATHFPNAQVGIYEKTTNLLAKVKISGGGRCNVTNACFDIPKFAQHYPRGNKQLKKAFREFSVTDTVAWFEQRGVALKAEEDGRMFPTTDDSQTIIDCLMREARKLGIAIHTKAGVQQLQASGTGWKIGFAQGEWAHAQAIIIATGGSPKIQGFDWLKDLGHEIIPPEPSLFTFNYPKNPVCQLMGVAVPQARVRIQGTKFEQTGPLLITHWGMSGPAVLKLSAFAARWMAEQKYHFGVQVSWVTDRKEEEISQELQELRNQGQQKQIGNYYQTFQLPQRLWAYLLDKAQIPENKRLLELSNKEINRLVQLLINDTYQAAGKTTFKEEFVTCGGVSLQSIDFKTMESKVCPKLFFAGEVIDVDGVTGGFNFQAAWTTGFIAGKNSGI